MRLLFIADGRSPTAKSWMDYFLAQGKEVHLVSTFACEADKRLASLRFLPLAFSGLKGSVAVAGGTTNGKPPLHRSISVNMRTGLRQWLGPFTLLPAAKQLSNFVKEIRPDLVHAMRIPFEGMAAARASFQEPLVISVWGNDFTLHARANFWMGSLTRDTLRRADALHTDCYRDARLAHIWGFDSKKPGLVVPGAGGIRTEIFYPPAETPGIVTGQSASTKIVNPRGFRAYVRNDIFFKAIPLVLAKRPEAQFFCPAMAGERQAQKWVRDLDIAANTALLPHQTRREMADLYRSCSLVVSPSTHDGTPNTLLEAMACGCFPIAGDLESIREWVDPGTNGYLVNPANEQELAQAMLTALDNPALLNSAREINRNIIQERANYEMVMEKVGEFYTSVVSR